MYECLHWTNNTLELVPENEDKKRNGSAITGPGVLLLMNGSP
jgi:hypothetical protein